METQSQPFNIAILAAGAASRFGTCKLLETLQNHPIIDYSRNISANTEAREVFIITGGWQKEIEAHLYQRKHPRESYHYCENWKEGMGASIKHAAKINAGRQAALLILLADQPLTPTQCVNQLIALWQRNPRTICCSEYSGTLGVPAIFPADYHHQLLKIPNKSGAKRLLNSSVTHAMPLPEAAWDIDTPEDLAKVKKRLLSTR